MAYDWQRHQAELEEMKRRNSDVFGAFKGIPEWLKGAGDAVGGAFQNIGGVPVLGGAITGALQGLDTLAMPARYGAGAAGLLADVAGLNTGLGPLAQRMNERDGGNFLTLPMKAQSLLFNEGFQGIAEDESMPAWARVTAQVPRATELIGEMRAPLPGIGAARALKNKEGPRAALRDLTFGNTRKWDAKQTAKNVGLDLIPGYREFELGRAGVRKVKSIGERKKTTQSLDSSYRKQVDDFLKSLPEDARAAAEEGRARELLRRSGIEPMETPRTVEERTRPFNPSDVTEFDPYAATTTRDIAGEHLRPIRVEVQDSLRNVVAGERMTEATNDLMEAAAARNSARLAETNEILEALEAEQRGGYRYGGRAVYEMPIRDLHLAHGVSYGNTARGREAAATNTSSRGSVFHPGINLKNPEPHRFGIDWADREGKPVLHMALNRTFSTSDGPGQWSVESMYLDHSSPSASTALKEIGRFISPYNVNMGGTLSYESLRLLHKRNIQSALARGKHVPDEVLKDTNPEFDVRDTYSDRVTERSTKRLYTDAEIEKWRAGKIPDESQLSKRGSTVEVEAPGVMSPELQMRQYGIDSPELVAGLNAQYKAVRDFVEPLGVNVVDIQSVSSSPDVTTGDRLRFEFRGGNVESHKKAAAAIAHFYDSPTVEIFTGDPRFTAGTEHARLFVGVHALDPSLLNALKSDMDARLGPAFVRNPDRYIMTSTWQGATSPGMLNIDIPDVNADIVQVMMHRASQMTVGEGYSSRRLPFVAVKGGRKVTLGREAWQQILASEGRGISEATEGVVRQADSAGGSGSGASVLPERGAGLNVRPSQADYPQGYVAQTQPSSGSPSSRPAVNAPRALRDALSDADAYYIETVDGSRWDIPTGNPIRSDGYIRVERSTPDGDFLIEDLSPDSIVRVMGLHDTLWERSSAATGSSPATANAITNVTDAINDPMAASVVTNDGFLHDLPHGRGALLPGGAHVRVRDGTPQDIGRTPATSRIARDDIVAVVDTVGNPVWRSTRPAHNNTVRGWFGDEGASKSVGDALSLGARPLARLLGRRLSPEGTRSATPEELARGFEPDVLMEDVPAGASTGDPTRGTGGVTGRVGTEPFNVAPVEPGVPLDVARVGPRTPESAVIEETMVRTPMREMEEPRTSMAEAFLRAQSRQASSSERIIRELRRTGFIRGDDAMKLQDYFERATAEGDVIPEDFAKAQKILEPIITAQKYYDSVKDINDQLASTAKQALALAEEKYGASLREVMGVERAADRLADAEGRVTASAARRIGVTEEVYAERVKAIEERVERAFQALSSGETAAIMSTFDDLDVAIQRLEGPATPAPRRFLSRSEAERLANRGYLSPADKELLTQYGFNTGKFPPVTARQIAETIRSHADEWTQAHQTFGYADQLQMAAKYVGARTEDLEALIRERGLTEGETSSFLIGLRLTTSRLAKNVRDMVRDGKPDAEVSKALEDFNRFMLHSGGATSEVARALGSQRLVITERMNSAYGVNGHLRRVGADLKKVEGEYAKAQKKLDDIKATYDRRLEELVSTRESRLGAAEDARTKAIKKELERAQSEYEVIAKRRDTLREAYGAGVERVREAMSTLEEAALKAMVTSEASIEQVKTVMKVAPDDIQALVAVIQESKKITRGDQLVAFYANNAFSGIFSQEANAIGGFLRLGENVASTFVAEKLGLGGRAFEPGETAAWLQGAKRGLMEPGDEYFFLGHALPRAFQVAIDTMVKGQALEEGGLRHSVAFKGKRGIALEGWIRLNGSFDSFWRHVVSTAETEALYLNHARKALRDAEVPATPDNVAQMVAELKKEPPQELINQSANVARSSTYAPAEQSEIMNKVFGLVNHRFDLPGLGSTPLLRMFFLAARFSWNATVFSTDLSPIGLARSYSKMRAAAKYADVGEMAKAEELSRQAARLGARGAIGSTAIAVGMKMYADGTLIGKDHEGLGRDDSIKVGDTYVPLRVLWPLSSPFIYTAHVADAIKEGRMKEEEFLPVLAKSGLALGDALMNQPLLRTTNDIMNAVHRPGEQSLRWVAAFTGRFIPWSSFDRDVARMVDEIDRNPGGNFFDMLKENIPGASFGVNPNIDRWGQPVLWKPAGLARLFPLASAEQESNMADKEISRLSQILDPHTKKPLLRSFEAPTKKVGNVTLSESELSRWQTLAGQERKNALLLLVANQNWGTLTDKQKADEIEKYSRRALDRAKSALAGELMRSTDPQSQMKGMMVGISAAPGNFERAKMVRDVLPTLNANPTLAKAFDEMRGPGDLTLAEYKQVVPFLDLLENSPEFATLGNQPIGNEKIWKQYHSELRQYNRILANSPKRSGVMPVEARIFLMRHPVLRRYLMLAQRPGGKNPVLKRLRDRNPVLNRVTLPTDDEDDLLSASES